MTITFESLPSMFHCVQYHAATANLFGRFDSLVLVDPAHDNIQRRKWFKRQAKYKFSRVLGAIVAGNAFK